MLYHCEYCGQPFEAPAHRRSRFCSRKCAAQVNSKAKRKPPVYNVCETCGKQFETNRHDLTRGFGRFCSRECANVAKVTTEARICEHCGKPFETRPSEDNHFCSHLCSIHARIKYQVCEVCGRTFWARAAWGRRYCSLECKGIASRTKVERTCEACGKVFLARGAAVDSGQGRYCSRSCASKNQPRAERIHRTCPICNKRFSCLASTPRTYCSRKCFSSSQTRHMETCLVCGKEFTAAPAANRKFCSRECMAEAMRVPDSDRFEYSGFTGTLRERIRERDDRTCQLCGEPEGAIKLDVHHINYRKDDAHSMNLVALCHSCHSKTHRNRAEWKRHFQKLMRDRFPHAAQKATE